MNRYKSGEDRNQINILPMCLDEIIAPDNEVRDICHNVQIATDDKNHLVVVVDVTSDPVDKEQFHNIALQAKEKMGVDTITAIADKGYYSAAEFAKCKEDNIIPIVSKADHSHMAAKKEYGKTQFRYDEVNDGYICPQGHLLKAYNHRKENAKYPGNKRYQKFEVCNECGVKDKCSDSEKGRTIQDRPFQSFSYFLTRGTESVRTESLLHFLVYNMRRAINIIGTKEIIGILQG